MSNQAVSAGGCLVLAPGLLSGLLSGFFSGMESSAEAASTTSSGSLSRLLGYADQTEFPDDYFPCVESLVASVLLSEGSESGAAHITYSADYPDAVRDLEYASALLMRADPAYQQIDMNNATLGNPAELDLTMQECTALQETLNQHFVEDGIRFECKDPQRWYCHFESLLQITTTPLSAAIGRDVASVRPTGTDARRWRSKLAEIEMLLFEHPINIIREQNNKLPVNTLWLWGEGVPNGLCGRKAISVVTDDFYTRSLAQSLGLRCKDLPNDGKTFKPTGEAALLVIDKFTQQNIPRNSNSDEPNNCSLQWFDKVIGDQLWAGLQPSGWPEITLWLGDNRLFHIKASVKKQFIRRLFHQSKPLSAYLPQHEMPPAEGM